MKNVIYRKCVKPRGMADDDGWSLEYVTLTEEVNRLIVWNEGYIGEDLTLGVIKTFADWQRDEAIEFAVACAAEAIEDRAALDLKPHSDAEMQEFRA